MNKPFFISRFFFLIIMASAMILPPATAAAAAKTVAIVPFKINADRDMNYLRDGVADMLSSRIHKAGEFEELSRQTVEKALPPAPCCHR